MTTAAVAALLLAPLVSAPARAATSSTPPAPPAPRPAVVDLAGYLAAQSRISAVLPPRVAASPALGGSRVGVVADAGTGATAWSLGATTPMRPASTMKLATAVTTLSLVGIATRFPTTVLTGRTPTEIVLRAGGDPLLTSAQLSTLASATAARLASGAPLAGSTATYRISVRVDDTLFPLPTPATGWPSTYTTAVVTPVRALVRDGRNLADTSADAATYFSARLAVALQSALAARTDLTVSAAYAGRLATPAAATVLARFSGNTSGAALHRMLLISDNDIAEMLFRDNAIAARGDASWSSARATTRATMTALGIDTSGWAVYDGSGLSRYARMTARGMTQLLAAAVSPSRPALAALVTLLPVGGVSGTLGPSYQRFTSTPTSCAAGRVYGKTGSLFDTIALAGYAVGSDGRLKVFDVMLHVTSSTYSGLTIRQQVDRIPATATGCY